LLLYLISIALYESTVNSATGIISLSSGQVTTDKISLPLAVREFISRPLKSILRVETESTFDYLKLIVINPWNVWSWVKSKYEV